MMASPRASRAAQYPIEVYGEAATAMAGLDRLEEMVRTKVLRSAAFAGSDVFYKEMRMQVPVREGTLYNAIYQWHDPASTSSRQTYFIGPNKRKAPHWFFIEFGHWLYNLQSPEGKWLRSKDGKGRGPGAHTLPGARKPPVWVPPKPYARPTWEAKKQIAVQAMVARAGERLREVMTGGT